MQGMKYNIDFLIIHFDITNYRNYMYQESLIEFFVVALLYFLANDIWKSPVRVTPEAQCR